MPDGRVVVASVAPFSKSHIPGFILSLATKHPSLCQLATMVYNAEEAAEVREAHS